MNQLTVEWLAKAEADLRTARREMAADPDPNYDATCFHAQQCAEKYLKGRLTEAGIPFPRTHDLVRLVALALSAEPSWQALTTQVDTLTDSAVEARYPGASADAVDAAAALRVVEIVRSHVRGSLGLPL